MTTHEIKNRLRKRFENEYFNISINFISVGNTDTISIYFMKYGYYYTANLNKLYDDIDDREYFINDCINDFAQDCFEEIKNDFYNAILRRK